jgi:hypothetical protein
VQDEAADPVPVNEELVVVEEVVEEVVEPRFGRSGPPMRRSPLLTGLFAGLGLLLAYVAFTAVQNVFSIGGYLFEITADHFTNYDCRYSPHRPAARSAARPSCCIPQVTPRRARTP